MIYFIRAEGDGPIKIGTSEVMSNRMAQHAAKLGKPVGVLGVIEGGREGEQAIHARFAHLRIGKPPNEWFEAGPDLIAFIEESTGPWDGQSERPLGIRRAIVSLNVSEAYRNWMAGFAEAERSEIADLIDDALAAMAETRKFRKPPMR